LRALDLQPQVLRTGCRTRGQPHIERVKRAVPGILQLVGDAEMDAAWSGGGNANLRLAIVEVEPGPERVHASAGNEHSPAQNKAENNSRA
jgi:hypothetical protein